MNISQYEHNIRDAGFLRIRTERHNQRKNQEAMAEKERELSWRLDRLDHAVDRISSALADLQMHHIDKYGDLPRPRRGGGGGSGERKLGCAADNGDMCFPCMFNGGVCEKRVKGEQS